MSSWRTYTTLQVNLPMYDWPEVYDSTRRFWSLLRSELIEYSRNASLTLALPKQLGSAILPEAWYAENLFLSQTCGYPLTHGLWKHVHVLGTPVYAVDYCHDGLYASVVVVAADSESASLEELTGCRVAINAEGSQSGCNALRNLLQTHDMLSEGSCFSDRIVTGSHRASMQAVAAGKADVCCLDPVAWALAQRHEPCTDRLRILTHTAFTPALPLICSRSVAYRFESTTGNGAAALSHCVRKAWQRTIHCNRELAAELLLQDIAQLDDDHYFEVPDLQLPL